MYKTCGIRYTVKNFFVWFEIIYEQKLNLGKVSKENKRVANNCTQKIVIPSYLLVQ